MAKTLIDFQYSNSYSITKHIVPMFQYHDEDISCVTQLTLRIGMLLLLTKSM